MRLTGFAAALVGVVALGIGGAPGAADEVRLAMPRGSSTGPFEPRLRVQVSPEQAPWRALGKLQGVHDRLRVECTGALVGPRTVLTAAHCMFNPRTGQAFPPRTLHFLVGFEFERYADHAVVLSFVTGPGFDPTDTGRTRGSDWALLTLDRDVGEPNRTVAIREPRVAAGMSALLAGYSQMQPYVLTASPACRIVGQAADQGGRRFLRHDCESANGVSGAPLLVQDGGTWSIAGVHVAQRLDAEASGVAVMPDEARKRR